MKKDYSITKWFGSNLAKKLSKKIKLTYDIFNSGAYIKSIEEKCENLTYTARIDLHATELRKFLPQKYTTALIILRNILGEENPHETGMFKEFYWIMPIGKFIEKYGLANFEESISLIEEITKRNTGEYAIRPFIREYPNKTVKKIRTWAQSDNFHLRRLASEGLRPKLPWAPKLNTFINRPQIVFEILEILKEDNVKFVKKSVANNLTDYLKVNKEPTVALIKKWSKSKNLNTLWIVKHATRKIKII